MKLAQALAFSLGIGLSLCAACDAPQEKRPRPRVDKAELFGDAKLVPTREGEQARRELAQAGELQALLERAGFEDVRVSVSDAMPPRAAVVLSAGDLLEPREAARRLVGQVLGPDASLEIVVREAAEPTPRRPATDPLLWLALLALGASVAITARRWRAR